MLFSPNLLRKFNRFSPWRPRSVIPLISVSISGRFDEKCSQLSADYSEMPWHCFWFLPIKCFRSVSTTNSISSTVLEAEICESDISKPGQSEYDLYLYSLDLISRLLWFQKLEIHLLELQIGCRQCNVYQVIKRLLCFYTRFTWSPVFQSLTNLKLTLDSRLVSTSSFVRQ